MTTRLDPGLHPWLVSAAAKAIFDALEAAAGARPAVRFVGGCVRNALRGAPVDDIDMATVLPPQEVSCALEDAGVRVAPTGVAHGTVTAVIDGEPFEITTLRRDVSTDGRNATVAYSEDWVEDSARRDFRLNAIYADRDGTIFDPQTGVPDALAGRVVFIGDADTRIREDYLRILRFFRFSAWYGATPIDAAGLAACAAGAAGLSRLSAERVWKELKKLFAAPDPHRALCAMGDSGVLREILPEAAAPDAAFAALTADCDDPLVRLAKLLPRERGLVATTTKRLKLANAEAATLIAWASDETDLARLSAADPVERATTLYHARPDAVLARLRHAQADATAAGDGPAVSRVAALSGFVRDWRKPAFPLQGRDVIAQGVSPGPGVGAALAALERRWVASGFTLSKAALLAELAGDGAPGEEG